MSLSLLALAPAVKAHSPDSVTLNYDFELQELSVSIEHTVTNTNTHYIYEIVVEKNSVVEITESYSSQDTTSGTSDTFSIAAADGDILRVTAKCNILGQLSNQITVVDPDSTTTSSTTTETTTTTSTTSTGGEGIPTPLILGLAGIGAIAVILIAVVIFKKR